ncbi:MAG: ATP-binding cassette domain-containing protein [Lachnospiraceae bacterium]|nr:ATP-binding cassette domain-containing protein [Lachnospiraceae bacterium]
MAFLELKNIGKIYVSGANVAVGIRGVNLSFEKGEFVAVTGESGSGKSTLLNVISGMDAYEEGEMLIEGNATSHYVEADREEYREQYISFIFQDYNILESFTVLQNVELALMPSIPDKAKRRARAVELLKRVGLGDRLHQRGSKLSGGQKQRTVIARALAKDSPIILADEPTGNLDSESAKEIIALLKEVSRDRLLIMVTHNLDEVAAHATREIRVFDGKVVSDVRLREPALPAEEDAPSAPQKAEPAGKEAKRRRIRDGITLGLAMFGATPKLSLFLCLLMLLGTLGLLSVTGQCGKVPEMLSSPTMFAPMEGRLVVTRSDGESFEKGELEKIADETGALSFLHYDYLLDAFREEGSANAYLAERDRRLYLKPVFGEHFSGRIYGREPREENEALLYLPISMKPQAGSGDDIVRHVSWCRLVFDVVGVQYYLDNNLPPKLVLTEDGFSCALAACLLNDAGKQLRVGFAKGTSRTQVQTITQIIPAFDLPLDKVYVSGQAFTGALDERIKAGSMPYAEVNIRVSFRSFNRFLSQLIGSQEVFRIEETLPGDLYLREKPEDLAVYTDLGADASYAAVNVKSARVLMEDSLKDFYTQASLFYGSEKKAEQASSALRGRGYTAALSTARYSPEAFETVLDTAGGFFMLLLWILTVIFLAFFINLCTGKAVGAFKHDLAILRSMGIPVRTVIAGLFTRLFLSLLPSAVFVLLLAFVLYRIPAVNAAFPWLYPWQYLMVFTGMILTAARVGRKQVKKLFGESVREALRGGDEA